VPAVGWSSKLLQEGNHRRMAWRVKRELNLPILVLIYECTRFSHDTTMHNPHCVVFCYCPIPGAGHRGEEETFEKGVQWQIVRAARSKEEINGLLVKAGHSTVKAGPTTTDKSWQSNAQSSLCSRARRGGGTMANRGSCQIKGEGKARRGEGRGKRAKERPYLSHCSNIV